MFKIFLHCIWVGKGGGGQRDTLKTVAFCEDSDELEERGLHGSNHGGLPEEEVQGRLAVTGGAWS